MKFIVAPTYEKMRLFGWELPFRYRIDSRRLSRNYRMGSSLLTFDIRNQEIRETLDGKSCVLAKLKMTKFSKRLTCAEDFVGEIILDEESKLHLELDQYSVNRITVFNNNEKSWSFLVKNPVEWADLHFRVKGNGVTLFVDFLGERSWRSPEEGVQIECNDQKFKLAKVIGVVACSLFFDYLPMRGTN